MRILHKKLIPLTLFVAFNPAVACKKPVESEILTEEQKEFKAIEDTGNLIDEGLTQLLADDQLSSPDAAGADAMGLTRAPARANPFAKLVQNVQTQWQTIRKNPCSVWKPLLRSANGGLLRPYFFVGGSAEAGAGLHGVVGRDFVWDFYNLQFASFTYKSLEVVLGSGTVGAGVNSYLGLAFGVRNDVDQAWSGRFAASGASGSLPVLSDYLSAHANYFTSVGNSGKPDLSLLGASVGLSLALSVPTTVPGAIQISQGDWSADPQANKLLAGKLSAARIPHALAGRETCNGKCIRFDNKSGGKGYTGRMVNLIRSFPAIMNADPTGSFSPQMDKIMLLALAVGAYRDSLNATYLCRK
ncbi:MAG: hypothetical protein EBR09_09635 [Proteobacteria bacterium]|nr:hypothetical protein [Pseudomonadota bacterium]